MEMETATFVQFAVIEQLESITALRVATVVKDFSGVLFERTTRIPAGESRNAISFPY